MEEKVMTAKEVKLRKLAEMLVKNPEATSIVASIFYDNAKHGARRVSEQSFREINLISEYTEEDIPIEVLRFLKKSMNIQRFFDEVRKEIVARLKTTKYFNEQIVKFIDCFDCKMLEKYIDSSSISQNEKRLVTMVCIEEAGIFYDEEPAEFVKLFKKLNVINFGNSSAVKATKLLTNFYAPKGQ